MTWLDVLLVGLWSMAAALGWQLGFAGLLWTLSIVLAAFALGSLALGPVAAGVLGLALGSLLAAAMHRGYREWWQPYGPPSAWAGAAGLLGGVLAGGVLCAALALAFPLSLRIDATGQHYQYPSGALPTPVQRAVSDSVLVQALSPVWQEDSAAARLLVPGSPHRSQP